MKLKKMKKKLSKKDIDKLRSNKQKLIDDKKIIKK